MGFVRYELRRRVVPDQTIYQIQAPSAFEYASNAPLPGLSMRFLAVFPSDLNLEPIAHLSNPHPLDPIRTYFISLPSFGINLHHRYVVGHSLSHVYTPRTAAQTSVTPLLACPPRSLSPLPHGMFGVGPLCPSPRPLPGSAAYYRRHPGVPPRARPVDRPFVCGVPLPSELGRAVVSPVCSKPMVAVWLRWVLALYSNRH